MPIECPPNAHRMPTECQLNANRMPIECQLNAHRMPTERPNLSQVIILLMMKKITTFTTMIDFSKPPVYTTVYFGPISYYAHIVKHQEIIIEAHENYNKQTYRNRCGILSANGPLTLTVPVTKGDKLKTPVREVQIFYETGWQRLHSRAILSAYRSAPFFEHYYPEIEEFFNHPYDFLWDLNMGIMKKILELLEAEIKITLSGEFISGANYRDYRHYFHPKQKGMTKDRLPEYAQVFASKSGFIPDLSILDALFNLGPDTLRYLQKVEITE